MTQSLNHPMAQSPDRSIAQSPAARRPITVVGSLMADVFVRAPDWPAPGAVAHGESALIDGGGKGANQALMVARMGWPVSLIGCVGTDIAGAGLLARLSASGVDTSRVLENASAGTGLFVLLSSADGRRGALAVNGANSRLRVEDVRQHADAVRTSAALIAQLEIPAPVAEAALRIASEAGALTVFNAAPRFEFPRSMLAWCDYVVVNDEEAGWLAGVTAHDVAGAAEAARRIEALGARSVLVTMGARGVWARTRDWQGHAPAPVVTPDDADAAVGAGDAFVGALTVRLCEGAPAREAVRFASAAATLSVTRRGAQAGLPARRDVEALLQQAMP